MGIPTAPGEHLHTQDHPAYARGSIHGVADEWQSTSKWNKEAYKVGPQYQSRPATPGDKTPDPQNMGRDVRID